MVLHITPGERDALQMLADGVPPRAIAERLGTTECDVGAWLNSLFSRMGAACATDALAVALRRGLLDPMTRPGDDGHGV
jgi:DNA-binding NarL/FixJ family response regulator